MESRQKTLVVSVVLVDDIYRDDVAMLDLTGMGRDLTSLLDLEVGIR